MSDDNNASYTSHMIKTAEWNFDNTEFVLIEYDLGKSQHSLYIDRGMFHKIYKDLLAAEQKVANTVKEIDKKNHGIQK